MGDDDHGATSHQPPHGGQHVLLGPPVEIGGGLVEEQQRGVPHEGPGQGDPLALARRESGPVVAQHRVQTRREAAPPRRRDRRRSTAARTWSSVASGRPRRTLSAIDRAKRCGRWGTQATWARQASGSRSARLAAPYRDRAAPGGGQTEQDAQEGRLPAPARPGDGHDLAGIHREGHARQGRERPIRGSGPPAGRLAERNRDGSGTSRAGASGGNRALEHLEDVLGRLHPFGTGVIVRAEQAEREVGLGGQDEHEQGGGQAQMTAQQPETDGHRHQGHREGGQQLEDERRKERHLERGHGRRAVPVGDVADRGHLGLGPTEDLESRKSGDHVEEVSGQTVEEPGLALHPDLGRRAHQRHEQRDQRDGDGDDQPPRSSRTPSTTTMTVTGTITARNSWGRYRAK